MSSISSFALLALLLLSSRLEPASAQEAAVGFSYVVGSPTGPERWGDLRPEWATCKNGMMQSPIDIRHENVQELPSLGRLMPIYSRSNATIQNTGYNIKVEWENGAGSININGTEYVLVELHWHWPTEHFINGRRYALELHMVHKSSDGKIAVIGILYKLSPISDLLLTTLTKAIQNVTGTLKEKKPIGAVDPRCIYIGFLENYYRYMGSLTIPPCSQGVVWTVLQKVRFVSQNQVTLLQNAVNNEFKMNNARPLQPLNGRPVYANCGF
ncbi:Bifunctional monodehydroascorbate reductase and carbonic anhydrase nectarin-3 [Acorus calamus]|uniref:Bifunctional monodehydroascorbate reductase and carbonic anhydrase nectarin-3 n=1 Tax=Acorus calamus TaxID=4465 RepID=A0AAV9EPP6_ACOCL|nr:Bifunctional monodehydroascorbate reductase and carbonic anhydrase nectarin-3 [Acorus calamus]